MSSIEEILMEQEPKKSSPGDLLEKNRPPRIYWIDITRDRECIVLNLVADKGEILLLNNT